LLYVDNCLVIGENAKSLIKDIDKLFPMRLCSAILGPPTIYLLGAKMGQTILPNKIRPAAGTWIDGN